MSNQYYLAYGSNLNINQMQNRCPSAKIIGKTVLNNYRLIYKGLGNNYSYLTIEKFDGSYVPIGIYLIGKKDILSLDDYEGYPILYYKKNIQINVNKQFYNALIYIMNDYFNYAIPSKSYLDTCMIGYDNFGFDKNILNNALDNTKTKIKSK